MADLPPIAPTAAFLAGGGLMGELVQAHDWSASPLGPLRDWPQSLRTAVGMVLTSKFPSCLVWGPGLTTLYNDAFRPILGNKSEALGRPFSEVWSEAWDKIGLIAERAFAGEPTFIEDFPLIVERNGYPEQAYFTFCYSPVRDETGEVAGFLDTVIETTAKMNAGAERGQAEEALRESEARLRALTDNLPAGMVYQIATGKDGSERRFLYISQSHERLTGIPADAVLADPAVAYQLIVPEHRAALAKAEAEAIRKLHPFDVQVQFRRADGELRWCRIISAPRPQVDGSLIWDGIQIDVTEQKEAEHALRASEMRFQGIVDSIDQMIWSTRADGYHDYFNQRWYEYTGVPEGSTEGEAWNGMFHPEDQDRAWAVWRNSLETGAPYHIEYRLRHRSGEYRWVLGRAQPVRDEAGGIARWFGTCTDIDDIVAAREVLARSREELEALVVERTRELVEAQGALAQAQKMEAVGQLTGGIAHDFNNLLQGVAGSLDLIRRRPSEVDRVRRWAEAGLQAAERGAKLTGQLLTFSRAQQIQLQPLIASDLILEMQDLLARTLGPMIMLKLDLSDGRLAVYSDPTQLEMAVLNLAINARDAMPQGGDLAIATKSLQIAQDPELEAGEYLEISVSDTGGGMPPDVAARAFDPFFTTKGVGKGTGLGLSQVYGIARQSGGTARIESRPNEGTTVRLLLRQTVRAADSTTSERPEDLEADEIGARVLVIDDDSDVRRFLIDSLNGLGFKTMEAEDGSAGLAALERSAPDVMLVDFAMPGINGAEVARTARELHPTLPVVFASGYAETSAIELLEGPKPIILRKPFRVRDLQAAIAEALKDPR